MAVERFRRHRYYRCLSSDTKPTNPSFDVLVETDTGLWFVWSGTAWVAYQEA